MNWDRLLSVFLRLTSPPYQSSSTPKRNLNILQESGPATIITNGTTAYHQQQLQPNGISNGGTIHQTFQIPSDSIPTLPPLNRIPSIPKSPNHHTTHYGVLQRSPPDRKTPPPLLPNTSPPADNGRYSPFHQRSRIDPDRCSQSPPTFQDSGGRFSPFNQRNIPNPDGRFSPFQRRDGGVTSSPYQQRRNVDGFWQTPLGSPLPVRKKYQNTPLPPEPTNYNIGNTSPIVLQRFYHQQNQLQKEQQKQEFYYSGNQPETSNKDDQGKHLQLYT